MPRITWRLQRIGLMAMTGFGVFYGLIQASAYKSAAGTTSASQAAFGHQMEVLGNSLIYLLPKPVGLYNVSGFLQWRVFGALPLLFGVWLVVSAAGASRGDEERGLVDGWLSAGASPTRYLAARFFGFVGAAAISVAATSAAIDLGAVSAGTPLNLGGLAEVSVALLALVVACYAIVLVIAQLTATRNSTLAVASAVLLAMFFINSLGRSVAGLRQIARFVSPFYYYDRSNPLTPGGSFDVAGTIGLLVAAVALTSLAAGLMQLRDLGSPLIRRRAREAPHTQEPSHNPLLRRPILSALYEQRLGLLGWVVGTSFAAAYMASLGHQLVDLTKGPSAFRIYLTLAGHGDPYVALTGFFWFGIFQLLLAAYAIAQVARWASDDNEGRLEMVLSAPVSRTRVILERAATLVIGTSLVVTFSSLAFYFGAHSAGIDVHAKDLFLAAVAAIPFGVSFAAVGALLASRLPRQTVGVLAAVVFLSYIITQLGPLLKWPDWVMRLSLLSLYGNPLTNGIDRTGLSILIAVCVVGFALGAILLQRRDVGA
jgi:ABC-2 type transport system permease protein